MRPIAGLRQDQRFQKLPTSLFGPPGRSARGITGIFSAKGLPDQRRATSEVAPHRTARFDRLQEWKEPCVLRRGEPLVTRAAIYARVSTSDQSTDLQLEALRAYAAARGWAVTDFFDHGVSGAKEKRPALDALVAAARVPLQSSSGSSFGRESLPVLDGRRRSVSVAVAHASTSSRWPKCPPCEPRGGHSVRSDGGSGAGLRFTRPSFGGCWSRTNPPAGHLGFRPFLRPRRRTPGPDKPDDFA